MPRCRMPRHPVPRPGGRRWQVKRCRLSLARSVLRFRYRLVPPAVQQPRYYPEQRWRPQARLGPAVRHRCRPLGQWRLRWPARSQARCQMASTERTRLQPIKEAQWQSRPETDPSGRRTLNILLNAPASPRSRCGQQTLRPIGDVSPNSVIATDGRLSPSPYARLPQNVASRPVKFLAAYAIFPGCRSVATAASNSGRSPLKPRASSLR
jgi:hypothetical protein